MLRIIDTNMAIRYMMQDDIKLAIKVRDIVEEGAYILPESLCEMIYVLNKGYKIKRKETAYALLDLLLDVNIFDKNLYENALRLYRESKLDFVDCIMLTRHRLLGDRIHTFDKELNDELKDKKLKNCCKK